MEIKAVLNAQKITELAKERFKEERSLNHLEGWFLAKEIQRECDEKFKDDPESRFPLETIMYLQGPRMTPLPVHMH